MTGELLLATIVILMSAAVAGGAGASLVLSRASAVHRRLAQVAGTAPARREPAVGRTRQLVRTTTERHDEAAARRSFVARFRARTRRNAIRQGLPELLDLLEVCLSAGCSLDQALLRAGQELGLSYPTLAREVDLMVAEVRAGTSRIDAFRNLAARTDLDEVRALAATLAQTERFGTSVAQALRTVSDTLRTRRRQHAEERAAKAGIKLTFPLVFCLFPAFYLVALGPALLRFMRVMVDVVGSAD